MELTPGPDTEVFVGVASYGNRVGLLEASVMSLLDQVDRVGVYLNNYDHTPRFLDHPKIEIARSQETGDLRDNGKFYFLDTSRHRFYAAADDDIVYPEDYVQRLKTVLAEAGHGSAIGVHGAVYPSRILGLFGPRHLYHFGDPLQHIMPVHLLGTGTLLFDQSTWNLEFKEFGEPGMADIWFATAAAKRSARLFVINRDRRWLSDAGAADGIRRRPSRGPNLFAEARTDDSTQVRLLREARIAADRFAGLVGSLIASDRFAEDFTLSQAMSLDLLRKELGWRPLEENEAETVASRIRALRSGWSGFFSTDEQDAHAQCVAEILADDVRADTVGLTLGGLDAISALSMSDLDRWRDLPFPLRFDSRKTRLEVLRAGLLERGMHRGKEDVKALWPRAAVLDSLPLDWMVEAERAGVDTHFQRSSRVRAAGAEDPVATALVIRDYWEAKGWSVVPDVLSWRRIFGPAFSSKEVQLLLCMVALRSGRSELATRRLEYMRHRWAVDLDVDLMEAAIASERETAVAAAMAHLIPVLDRALPSKSIRAYSQLPLQQNSRVSHWIELFEQPIGERALQPGLPDVSVIMTVFNNASTVKPAVSSILASSGTSVELIIVDDASRDGTADIVDGLADPRVRLLRNSHNLGPYVSRNRALEVATGEFIAISDADDWSHPDRLSYQCSRLRDEQNLVACTVGHVRVRSGGQVDLENHLLFVGDGPMSLMFRRTVVDQIGGFDHIRTRGDIEFMRRVKARFGGDSIASFGAPLVLATSSESSNSKRFTSDALGRYRRAARAWHTENALSDALYVNLRGERATFIAPEELVVPSDTD